MRSLLILCALASSAVADDGSLWEAELRLGGGVAHGGHETMATNRPAPLTVSAIAAIAVQDEPRVYGFGGIVAETLERTAIGTVAGGRLAVHDTPVRLSGGGVWMFAPKTLWGATASVGACSGSGMFAVCGDVQLTAYFAGTALAKDDAEVQLQFVIAFMTRGGR